jgi:hypothetical protein
MKKVLLNLLQRHFNQLGSASNEYHTIPSQNMSSKTTLLNLSNPDLDFLA